VTEEKEKQELAEATGTGELGPGAAKKGPVLDQDPGPVQEADPVQRAEFGRGSRKERVGIVVSDKPDKTVTVSVETLVQRFMVHDEQNAARVGDTVRIIETRPISARKRWRLANIISKAQ
jgi:small subunit ribosomal protein S17